MPGGSRSTADGDSRRGADSGGDSNSRSRGQTGAGEETASGTAEGVDATGKDTDDISFEEPEASTSAAAGGQQPGSSGDLSVEAAADDQVLQEAFEVFDAQGKRSPGQPAASEGQGAGGPAGSGAAGAASGSAADRMGELNAELDSALGTFDGVILAQRDAATGDENAAADGADNGADDAALEEDDGDFGGGFTIPAAPVGRPAGGGPGAAGTDVNSNGNGTQPPGPGDNRQGDYQHASTGDAVPADIPDGSDDDVVARQIREAAQRETDPELREKLWDEYRNYKKGK